MLSKDEIHKGPSINYVVSAGWGESKISKFDKWKDDKGGGRRSKIADFETT